MKSVVAALGAVAAFIVLSTCGGAPARTSPAITTTTAARLLRIATASFPMGSHSSAARPVAQKTTAATTTPIAAPAGVPPGYFELNLATPARWTPQHRVVHPPSQVHLDLHQLVSRPFLGRLPAGARLHRLTIGGWPPRVQGLVPARRYRANPRAIAFTSSASRLTRGRPGSSPPPGLPHVISTRCSRHPVASRLHNSSEQ